MTEMNELLDQIKIIAYTKYMEKFCRVSKIIKPIMFTIAFVIVLLVFPYYTTSNQLWIGNVIFILSGLFWILFIINTVSLKIARKTFESKWNQSMKKEL